MENNLNDFSYKKDFECTQVKNEVQIDFTDLKNVLTVNAEAIILSSETVTGEIRFSGEVCYNVIYIDNDNTTKSVRSFKDFNGKITDESITTLTKPILEANVIDQQWGISGENQIIAESVVCVKLQGYMTQSFKELDEKRAISQKSKINMCHAFKSGESRINLEEKFTLKEKPLEILSVNSKLIPKNYQTGSGYIEFDALLSVWVVYTVQRDEKTEMRSEILKRDIKEEVEVTDAKKGNMIIASLSIKNCSIDTKTENNQLTVNIPVDVKYVLFNQTEKEIIVDAFSPEYETQLTYDTITLVDKMEKFVLSERVNGEIEFDESHTRINRILSTDGGRVSITNLTVNDGSIKIDGIVYFNIIYQLDDDAGTIMSTVAEIPFSVNLDIPIIQKSDFVDTNINITDISCHLRRGRTIDTDIELTINITVTGQKYESVIKEIQLLSEVPENKDSNFMIYFGRRGDTLWNICKKLKVSEEKILLQNQNLTFPLDEDKTIVIYKRVDINGKIAN